MKSQQVCTRFFYSNHNVMSISVIPYSSIYDAEIQQLEKATNQGMKIKLQILKNHFLDRSLVFKKSFPCIAVDQQEKLIGTCIGAQTDLIVNGDSFDAGFAFDVKVHPLYRNKGVARMMAKYIYSNFFKAEGLQKNFTTLKRSNIPVLKLSAKAVGKIWLYDFVYLTIPTKIKIKAPIKDKSTVKLSIKLFQQENLSSLYYTNFVDGLGCFHTHKLYQLKIEKLSWLYRQGLGMLKKVNFKYSFLPKENEIMLVATLYNHTAHNIESINNVLDYLDKKDIKYLLVCCRKKDSIYNYLKKYSINSYGYYILSDFLLSDKDEVGMDIRCL